MHKKFLFLLFFFLSFSFIFVGCTNNSKHEITFYSENYGIVKTYQTNGNEQISLPLLQPREGYHFCGWYWDDKTFLREFKKDSLIGVELSYDVKIYAKWITENDYKIEVLQNQLIIAKNEYSIANDNYSYYLNLKNIAYSDYINKQNQYKKITIRSIRVYRSGVGFVYEDDPADVARKKSAKIAMDEAKKYYNECINYCEQTKKIMDEKYSYCLSIEKQIIELGGNIN